jgi:hypothetical protein
MSVWAKKDQECVLNIKITFAESAFKHGITEDDNEAHYTLFCSMKLT